MAVVVQSQASGVFIYLIFYYTLPIVSSGI